jgi:hypothetical protein
MADVSITTDLRELNQLVGTLDRTRVAVKTLAQEFAKTNDSSAYMRGINNIVRSQRNLEPSARRTRAEIMRMGAAARQQALGLRELGNTAGRVGAQLTQVGARAHQAGLRMNRTGVITQQAGYQIGDFIVQVQSGTNAFVAFGQQATQVAGTLTLLGGRWVLFGSVLGVVIPLLTAAGAAIVRTGAAAEGTTSAFSQMREQLNSIEPIVRLISSAFSTLANTAIGAINLMVNNLDRLITYTLSAAAFFGTRYVAGVVAASVATASFSGIVSATGAAFVFLRRAIMATGIGLLIVAIGESVYQLIRLSEAVGGVGNLMGILGRVSGEVFERIRMGASLLTEIFDGLGMIISGSFQVGFSQALESFRQFLDSIISGLDILGSLWPTQLGGPWAVAGGQAALGSLSSGIGSATTGLLDRGRYNISGGQEVFSSASGSMSRLFTDEINSAEELRLALEGLDNTGSNIDVRDWFSGGEGASEDGAGGAVSSALEQLRNDIQSVADTMRDSMSSAFMSIVDGTKSAKEAFREMAAAIIRQLYEVLVVQRIVGQFDASTGTGSGLVGALMGGLGSIMAPASSVLTGFASGGYAMAGESYLVGESGPELFSPGRSGTITNNNLTASSQGSQQVEVRVFVDDNGNFDARVEQVSQRTVARAAPGIVQRSVGAVVEQTKRGGAIKGALR